MQSCTTNNKENFGLEPTIKKKTTLIDLKRSGFPVPITKQKSCGPVVRSASPDKLVPVEKGNPLEDQKNIMTPSTFCEPHLKHSADF